MLQPYKFSSTAWKEKPVNALTELLERAMKDLSSLTREEKDKVADILYGVGGCYSSTYKFMGWAWPMAPYLKRILVSFTYQPNTFNTYYAPDKTSLRKALVTSIYEMIETKRK